MRVEHILPNDVTTPEELLEKITSHKGNCFFLCGDLPDRNIVVVGGEITTPWRISKLAFNAQDQEDVQDGFDWLKGNMEEMPVPHRHLTVCVR